MRKNKDSRQEASSYIYKRKNMVNLPFLTCIIAPKIQYLDLSQNFLQNLKQFQGCKFSRLKILYLNNNMINNIDGLSQGYFPVLQKLFLYGNQINSLTPLNSIHAPKLTQLKLGFKNNGNSINEITLQQLMQNLACPQLTQLTLDYNQIHNINFISSCNRFEKLVLLYLSGNKIEVIDGTVLNQLKNVQVLSLRNNYIGNLKFMGRLYLPKLEQFIVDDNYILELSQFYQAELPSLVRFSLRQNFVNDVSQCSKCDFDKLQSVSFQNAQFIYQKSVLKQIYNRFFVAQ